MKTFLIKINTASYISIYIQKAENQENAIKELNKKFGCISFKAITTDISDLNFVEVLDYDKPDYEG